VISGLVKNRRATVNVTFCLPNQPYFSIEFVIDTGFTGCLCLPPEAVAVLGLPFQYDLPANLANNSNISVPLHSAVILWNAREKEVNVLAMGRHPLLGTALLDECELVAQFTEGGSVTIEAL
jgi:clan AA aspartic protease